MEKANVTKKMSNIKDPHHSLVKLWDVYILLSIPATTEHYLALCFYLLTRSLQTKISWSWDMRHTTKLSYQPQVLFTVSGDTVVKIQRDPPDRMLGSNFGQDKWFSCLWELVWVKWHKWLSQTTSFTWMTMNEILGARSWHATIIEKEGCMPLGCTGRPPSNGVTERTVLQPSSITDSSCVLLYCTSGTAQDLSCTKLCFSWFYTLFGLTSEHFTLQLRIWTLLCEKASAYMEDNVDLQRACDKHH